MDKIVEPEAQKKEILSYGVLKVQIADIIFMILLLLLNILRSLEIIKFSLVVIDIILSFGYWFASLIYIGKIETKEYKKEEKTFVYLSDDTPKHRTYLDNETRQKLEKKSHKMMFGRLIFVFVFLVFGFSLIAINTNTENKIFLRTADKTTAEIIDVDKEINVKTETRKTDDGTKIRTYYIAVYTYTIDYYVNNKNYKNEFIEEQRYGSHSKATASRSGYQEGEKITIYYNINNPDEFRTNVEGIANSIIYICLAISISVELILLFKAKKDFDKDVKQLESTL